eukprot:6191941-Pleurochrysis_carterae.AAC.8
MIRARWPTSAIRPRCSEVRVRLNEAARGASRLAFLRAGQACRRRRRSGTLRRAPVARPACRRGRQPSRRPRSPPLS